jgi:hypothetical protein
MRQLDPGSSRRELTDLGRVSLISLKKSDLGTWINNFFEKMREILVEAVEIES